MVRVGRVVIVLAVRQSAFISWIPMMWVEISVSIAIASVEIAIRVACIVVSNILMVSSTFPVTLLTWGGPDSADTTNIVPAIIGQEVGISFDEGWHDRCLQIPRKVGSSE